MCPIQRLGFTGNGYPSPAADQINNPDSLIRKEHALTLFDLENCECMHDPEIGEWFASDYRLPCNHPRLA